MLVISFRYLYYTTKTSVHYCTQIQLAKLHIYLQTCKQKHNLFKGRYPARHLRIECRDHVPPEHLNCRHKPQQIQTVTALVGNPDGIFESFTHCALYFALLASSS